jgi:DNA-directed RNA polymerase specialized sigma24 family protein
MPVKPPPVVAPRFSRVSAHAKDTIRRVRAYLRGLGSADLESLTNEAKTLTPNEWGAAFPQQRNNGKLLYCDPTSLDRVADAHPDPFETAYRQELVTLLEARLPPDQVPYLDAFLADEKPREIAPRLGITAKAASARMRRFRAKLAEIYSGLTPGLRHHTD